MVTVLRDAGFRFVIYLDDHEPAHVHAYGDGEARIDIMKLAVLSQRGMSRRDVAKALSIVSRNRSQLIDRWRAIHG